MAVLCLWVKTACARGAVRFCPQTVTGVAFPESFGLSLAASRGALVGPCRPPQPPPVGLEASCISMWRSGLAPS